MTAGDWPRIRAAFERAGELPAAQRAAFLDGELGRDTRERAEVERLLAAAADVPAEFLAPPGAATLGGLGAAAVAPGTRLGPFLIGRLLARGGMGSVFVAEQEQPARTVAVKVMHQALGVPRARARFQAEVDALARLQHPGIAPVFEAGVEADGTAWFAMELLADAVPITRHPVPAAGALPARLELFLQVAAALQHAHQRGVIHRDLKPANILVLPDGTVKVIDFGIARIAAPDREGPTLAGELLGTLAYMSPEQVEGRDTDVRTDVWGLGVVLYELLAGRPPFDLAGLPLAAACRALVEQDPAPLAAAGAPAELDWIVRRALRKDREARYPGVAEFAADVARFRRHEPVAAGPDTTGYRLAKFVRRNRVLVTAAASVLLVTIVAFVAVTGALWRAREAETAERERRAEAEGAAARATASLDFLLDVFSSVDPGKDGREVKMADALLRSARDLGSRFVDQPAIRAALGDAIGTAFFGLGLLAEAEQHLADAVTMHERCHGTDSSEVARTLLALGYVQVRRGDFAAAGASFARARTIAAARGDEPLQWQAGVREADLLRAKGDRQAAARLLEPLVATLRARRGKDHRDTLNAVMLLAGIRHRLGELDAAEPLYREALAGIAATRGQDHPDVLSGTNNLVVLLASRGRRADAVPLLEQILATRRRVQGPDHPDTIGAASNLGAVRFGLGQLAEAAAAFAAALESLDKITPKGAPSSELQRTLLANLATVERELGRLDRAREHGERALALHREHGGEAHDSTLSTATMLGEVYRQQREVDRALALFEDCRVKALAARPEQVANLYRADLGICRCLVDQQRFAEAETAGLRLLATYEAADRAAVARGQLSPPGPELHALYTAWGKPEEAAKYPPRAAAAK